MKGVVLVGHGSLRSASGAAMIRHAARLRQRRAAALVAPGFLNYTRPRLAEAAARLVAQGARRIVVLPYFLVAGKYVLEDLPQEVHALGQRFPEVDFSMGSVLGVHPHLLAVAADRLAAVHDAGVPAQESAVLVIAHGTPYPEANTPIRWLAERLPLHTGFPRAAAAYLDCNAPTVPQAVDALAAAGVRRILALPYFLQNGRHVREDVPRLLAASAQRHPDVTIRLAPPVGYDERLVDVLAERIFDKVTGDG